MLPEAGDPGIHAVSLHTTKVMEFTVQDLSKAEDFRADAQAFLQHLRQNPTTVSQVVLQMLIQRTYVCPLKVMRFSRLKGCMCVCALSEDR